MLFCIHGLLFVNPEFGIFALCSCGWSFGFWSPGGRWLVTFVGRRAFLLFGARAITFVAGAGGILFAIVSDVPSGALEFKSRRCNQMFELAAAFFAFSQGWV